MNKAEKAFLNLVPTPKYGRLSCKRALIVAFPYLQNKELSEFTLEMDFLKGIRNLEESGGSFDFNKSLEAISSIGTMSSKAKTAKDAEITYNKLMGVFSEEIRNNFPQPAEDDDIRAKMAFFLVSSVIGLAKSEESGVSSIEDLEILLEHINIASNLLLHFDSQMELIKTWIDRQNANYASNKKYIDLKNEFFIFYSLGSFKSKADAVRKFIRQLPEEKKKIYPTEDKAIRNLCAALRKHEKN